MESVSTAADCPCFVRTLYPDRRPVVMVVAGSSDLLTRPVNVYVSHRFPHRYGYALICMRDIVLDALQLSFLCSSLNSSALRFNNTVYVSNVLFRNRIEMYLFELLSVRSSSDTAVSSQCTLMTHNPI